MADTEATTTGGQVPAQRTAAGVARSVDAWLSDVLAAMGCRRSGRKWQCPAHGQTGLHSASLAIGRRDDGQGAWVHCHAGCSVTAVLRALGLRPAHLQRPPRVTPSRYVHLQGLRREWPELKNPTGHPEAVGYRHEAWHLYGPTTPSSGFAGRTGRRPCGGSRATRGGSGCLAC
jgi:hypothetical protein